MAHETQLPSLLRFKNASRTESIFYQVRNINGQRLKSTNGENFLWGLVVKLFTVRRSLRPTLCVHVFRHKNHHSLKTRLPSVTFDAWQQLFLSPIISPVSRTETQKSKMWWQNKISDGSRLLKIITSAPFRKIWPTIMLIMLHVTTAYKYVHWTLLSRLLSDDFYDFS